VAELIQIVTKTGDTTRVASSAAGRRFQGRHPGPPGAVWGPAVLLPTLAQEDCTRLTLVRFSSVGRAPTSATEPSVQLDLESGTICRRTSDSRTCHIAVSDSRWRRFYFVSGIKAQCELSPLKCVLEIVFNKTIKIYLQSRIFDTVWPMDNRYFSKIQGGPKK